MADVPLRCLGDVDGEVAHTLEVGVDLYRRDDGAKVDRHRLVEREQREAAVVDLDVQRVERAVRGQHARNQIAVAIDETFDRQAHLFLGEAAHLEESGLQLFELILKMADALFGRSHYPNLPVT